MHSRIVKLENEQDSARALVFESVRELLEYANRVTPSTFKGLSEGETRLVPRSDKILDQIETIEKLAEKEPHMQRAVAGGMADVPAFLQGSPINMRMRRRREAKAPITICVSSITSGGIKSYLIERRGVAVLALLRKLEAAGHAVTLHLTAGMKPYSAHTFFGVVPLESKPLDVARVAFALSDARVQRQVMFSVGCKHVAGSRNRIAWPYHDMDWNTRIADQQKVYGQLLDVDPKTILIVPPVFMDEADHFKTDETAAAWVNMRYAEASAIHEVHE